MDIIKCKKTGKEFEDISNKSGVLTIHLNSLNIEVPTSYLRRKYLAENKKFWHLQFFDIIKKEKKEKKCKYCDWKTVDIINKSGQYTVHLQNKHKKSIDEYIIDFPDEKNIFKTYFERLDHKISIEGDLSRQVECKICKEKFLKITNTHLKDKHGLSLLEYKLNYSTNTLSNYTLELQKEAFNNNLKMHESTFTSKGHSEIINFLIEKNIKFKVNDKKLLSGVELDILILDKKIAIEYNGLLYHSEKYGKKSRSFHLNKSRLCKEKDISLIHIFEDDWIQKKEIIKSKLTHLLGINTSKLIHARKCIIKEVPLNIKNNFLEENHIQGSENSPISIGAFYENELVSIASFDNKRYMTNKNNHQDIYELTRFCIKLNYRCPGVCGKLIKFLKNMLQVKSIISFADKCWTLNDNNNLYTSLGFTLFKEIGPDYKYFNPKISRNKRLHKFSFGKSSLKKKFPEIYSDSKTEWEIMQEAGYDRIWDCGKYKFVLNM